MVMQSYGRRIAASSGCHIYIDHAIQNTGQNGGLGERRSRAPPTYEATSPPRMFPQPARKIGLPNE
jgi:hypothetical protein